MPHVQGIPILDKDRWPPLCMTNMSAAHPTKHTGNTLVTAPSAITSCRQTHWTLEPEDCDGSRGPCIPCTVAPWGPPMAPMCVPPSLRERGTHKKSGKPRADTQIKQQIMPKHVSSNQLLTKHACTTLSKISMSRSDLVRCHGRICIPATPVAAAAAG
jgi:hypothetical protein